LIIVNAPQIKQLWQSVDRPPRWLGRWFSRARVSQLNPAPGLAQVLTGRALPSAALTRRLDAPRDCDGVWMRADPIELIADLNAVWVRPASLPAIEGPVISALQEVFAGEGLDYQPTTPDRGYVRLDRVPSSAFIPPWLLAGLSLDHALPEGEDRNLWVRLITECQTVLHLAGKDSAAPWPAGLWLWGAGRLPAADSVRPRVSHLIGQGSELLALADWLKLSHSPTECLPMADGSLWDWRAKPQQSARENLERLAEVLRTLHRRIVFGASPRLELAGGDRLWVMTQAAAWWVWRRPGALP